MANTVYVITDGEYSDYHIVAIFSNKDAAEALIAKIGEGGIEEWDLDEFTPDFLKNHDRWFIRMKKDGTAIEAKKENNSYGITTREIGFDVNNDIYCSIWAKSKEHAIKIAGEKRAQIIAENKWPTPTNKR